MAQTYPFQRGAPLDKSDGQKLLAAEFNTADRNAAQAADGLLWSDVALFKNFQQYTTAGGSDGCIFWDGYLKRWINGYTPSSNTPGAVYSFDGRENWASLTVATGANWGTVGSGASNGAGIVLLGGGGGSATASKIRRSADGGVTTWAAQSMTASSTEQVTSLAWVAGGARFIAGLSSTASTNIETSPDGVTWAQRTGLPNSLARGDIAANSTTVVMLASPATSTTKALRSTDFGATWSEVTLPGTARRWRSVTWNDRLGKFYAIAESGAASMASSADGSTWVTEAVHPFTLPARILSYGRLLVCGDASTLGVSVDGATTWTKVKNFTGGLLGMGLGDNQVVALGTNLVLTSLRGGL